jgi:hypothetical protein
MFKIFIVEKLETATIKTTKNLGEATRGYFAPHQYTLAKK